MTSPHLAAVRGAPELLLGHHVVDFWTAICVCHSLIVEDNPKGGTKIYQVAPPLAALRFQWS